MASIAAASTVRLAQAAATAAASASGSSPIRPAATASAASTSSNARSHAGSATAARTAPAASTPSKRPPRSDGEEDGLIGALQADVEAVTVAMRLGDQGPAAFLGHRRQDRVGGVGRLVGEVDPGHDPLEQPAREDRHVDVR